MSRSERSAREFATSCAEAAPRLACIAAGIIGERANAEDIVQQAITIAIEKDDRFETGDQFVAWLAGIVKNCALNFRRKKIRRKTHLTDPANFGGVEQPVNDTSPIDQQSGKLLPMQGSFNDRVLVALKSLSEEARSCLLLRTVEQLSYKEISELMDVTEGAAMNLVFRSKKKLRSLLGSADAVMHDSLEDKDE